MQRIIYHVYIFITFAEVYGRKYYNKFSYYCQILQLNICS